MILRAFFVLLGCVLATAHAAPATYDRGENFSTRPDAWTYFHPNQFYGYQAPSHSGGSGSAGGLFLPKTYFNYFADTHLNGTLTRGTTISASGRIHLQRISAVPPYTNTKADATATITVQCTPNIDYTIDIDRGLYNNGINRRMYNASANNYFDYDVYKDPPRSQVWGTGQTQNLPGNSGITGVVNYTVYGRTEQINRLKAGSYSDTLTITVTF